MHLIALYSGKLIQKILMLIKRKGGSLPGVIALKLDRGFLKKIKYPKDVILITGTNGKSTLTNMTYEVLKSSGKKVCCNLEGNNLKVGVVSILLRYLKLNNELNADALVLEVDELSIPRIMEDITPSMVVVNNFFRDQLDRAGEMENVVRKIENSLSCFKGQLILNGDDPNVARLALKLNKENVTYFGIDEYSGSKSTNNEASEGRFCPICKEELVYTYYQYSHIGRYTCLNDGFGNHEIKYLGKVIDLLKGEYMVNDDLYNSRSQTLFAFYNEVALVALCSELRIEKRNISNVIKTYKMNNGRMEVFTLKNGHICILNLAKNPTGFNESIKYILSLNKAMAVGLVLNDYDADGVDVSWIYDAQMEYLCSDLIKVVACSGTRYLDMALRMKYANFTGEIKPIDSINGLIAFLNDTNKDCFIIANYTSLNVVRNALKEGNI